MTFVASLFLPLLSPPARQRVRLWLGTAGVVVSCLISQNMSLFCFVRLSSSQLLESCLTTCSVAFCSLSLFDATALIFTCIVRVRSGDVPLPSWLGGLPSLVASRSGRFGKCDFEQPFAAVF